MELDASQLQLIFYVLYAVQIRLINGVHETWRNTTRDGRVEILSNGVWGTICDAEFDKQDADVICKQLGFPGNLSLWRLVLSSAPHDTCIHHIHEMLFYQMVQTQHCKDPVIKRLLLPIYSPQSIIWSIISTKQPTSSYNL